MSAPVPTWLTPPQAAKIMGVSATTAWRLLIQGAIPEQYIIYTKSGRARISRQWAQGLPGARPAPTAPTAPPSTHYAPISYQMSMTALPGSSWTMRTA